MGGSKDFSLRNTKMYSTNFTIIVKRVLAGYDFTSTVFLPPVRAANN